MVKTKDGQFVDRLSPWATYVKPPPTKEQGIAYEQHFWNPPASEVRARPWLENEGRMIGLELVKEKGDA